MGKISYSKLWTLMKERGLTTYRIEKDKIVPAATLQRIREGKNITMDTIASLCKALGCQPGDILEYVPDEDEQN